jgi:LPS sulfotransferase NodH
MDPTDLEGYVESLGDVVIKMHYEHMVGYVRMTGEWGASWHLTNGSFPVPKAFRERRWVRIVRLDTEAQAVSLWIADATQKYQSGWAAMGEPPTEYDFAAIDICRQRIVDEEAAWGRFFAVNRITPDIVIYEQLSDDPHRVLPELPADWQPSVEKQRTPEHEEWADRYRLEKFPWATEESLVWSSAMGGVL